MGVWQIKTGLGVNTTQGREAKHVQISSYERIACLNTVGIRFSGTITSENFGYLSVSHPYLHIINRETALSLIVSPWIHNTFDPCECPKNENDDKCFFLCGHK